MKGDSDNTLKLYELDPDDSAEIEYIAHCSKAQGSAGWEFGEYIQFLEDSHNHILLICQSDGEITGYVVYTDIDRAGTFKIIDMQVKPKYMETTYPVSEHRIGDDSITLDYSASPKTPGFHLVMQLLALGSEESKLEVSTLAGNEAAARILEPFEGMTFVSNDQGSTKAPPNKWKSNFDNPAYNTRDITAVPDSLEKRLEKARQALILATGMEWTIMEKRVNKLFDYDGKRRKKAPMDISNLLFLGRSEVNSVVTAHQAFEEKIGPYDRYAGSSSMCYHNTLMLPASAMDNILAASLANRCLQEACQPKEKFRGTDHLNLTPEELAALEEQAKAPAYMKRASKITIDELIDLELQAKLPPYEGPNR